MVSTDLVALVGGFLTDLVGGYQGGALKVILEAMASHPEAAGVQVSFCFCVPSKSFGADVIYGATRKRAWGYYGTWYAPTQPSTAVAQLHRY